MSTKISGFTFIKNGLTLGYPIKESVESILPLCFEVIINVGFDNPSCTNDDGTYDFLKKEFEENPKVKFLKSYWDPELTQRGLILSQQTNIALKECSGDYCQYIQGDEALHENDFDEIRECVSIMEKNKEIEGVIFQYHHFYGNTQTLKHTRNIYRREVRLIRNNIGIKSYLDAQGFKTSTDSKLTCIESSARVFHYGWARESSVMKKKVESFGKLYHGKDHQDNDFKYERIWGLIKFNGIHPKVMSKWITSNKNTVDLFKMPIRFEWKNIGLMISDFVERLTGYRIGEYKNFIKIKGRK
tara:strand:+ start:18341 stop:19240 length:900 start_codon:yes stop_codon:yes gene_type:complete